MIGGKKVGEKKKREKEEASCQLRALLLLGLRFFPSPPSPSKTDAAPAPSSGKLHFKNDERAGKQEYKRMFDSRY